VADLLPDDQRRWVRVARAVLADIESGKLKPGDQIPHGQAMAAAFGVSLGVVQRAVWELVDHDVIWCVRGTGCFVSYVSRCKGGNPADAGPRAAESREAVPPGPGRAGDAVTIPASTEAPVQPAPRGSLPADAPRFLTVDECAAQARVTKATIYRLLDEGVIEGKTQFPLIAG
jgi:DNA-binding transcriptional MocR family regulator